ncbi:OmpA family protein [Spirochaetia bacterium 38H-sp]|uniref:OmpA family protein n=1 Tax=Rarispira pelagica TaxID=3141764 RepID=A0ABU9UDD6_9SPIR
MVMFKRFLCVVCFSFISFFAFSIDFAYGLAAGQMYRVVGLVEETVSVGGQSYFARVLNKSSISVEKAEGNRVFCKAVYVTAEEFSGLSLSVFNKQEDSVSEYWIDRLGNMEIDDSYRYPIVRNVPLFPGRELEAGDVWSASGYEVHYFDELGIKEPFKFPVNVSYIYVGPVSVDGNVLHRFDAEYPVFYRRKAEVSSPDAPVEIRGYSRQEHYWDVERGMDMFYREEFYFALVLNNGAVFEFDGKANAKVVWASPLDKAAVVDAVEKDIDRLDVPDASVESTEEGVKITLDNIRFPPDSAVLLPSEQDKLKKIAEILRKYPDRDLKIAGHTALAGTAEGRQKLSIERARAVAEFLLSLGVRSPEQMLIEGYGATRPVASNATEEGRKKNRRVEIIILEN